LPDPEGLEWFSLLGPALNLVEEKLRRKKKVSPEEMNFYLLYHLSRDLLEMKAFLKNLEEVNDILHRISEYLIELKSELSFLRGRME